MSRLYFKTKFETNSNDSIFVTKIQFDEMKSKDFLCVAEGPKT